MRRQIIFGILITGLLLAEIDAITDVALTNTNIPRRAGDTIDLWHSNHWLVTGINCWLLAQIVALTLTEDTSYPQHSNGWLVTGTN